MYKYSLTVIFALLIFQCSFAQLSKEDQIKSALLATTEDKRENATVIGLDDKGNTIVLQKGTNEIICLADDSRREGFSVASYHKDLDPFMERGRQLRAEGKGFKEVFEIRSKEAEEGKFKIPDKSILNIVQGDGYDSSTGTIVNEYRRWVFYIPYATGESTGLPEAPNGPGAPWIMNPGTFTAHIMISPAKK